MKRSKKVGLDMDFYFTVYSLIEKGLNPAKIYKKLNISKHALNYYTAQLKRDGYIEKLGYGVWKTSKNFDFNTLNKTSKKIRSHAFIFSLSLPKIENWDKREEFFKKNNIIYKNFTNRNIQKLKFKGYKTQIGNKKIVVYMPKWKSYFVDAAKTGYNYAVFDFIELIKSLETLFNTKFKVNKGYKFRVARQHHALIHNELARQYNRENRKLEVRDELGYLWLLIDNSSFENIKQEEMECVDKIKAPIDTDEVINPFMNTLRKNPDVLNKIIITQEQMQELLNLMNENMVKLTKNDAYFMNWIKKNKE